MNIVRATRDHIIMYTNLDTSNQAVILTVVHNSTIFHNKNDESNKRDSYGFPIQSKTK